MTAVTRDDAAEARDQAADSATEALLNLHRAQHDSLTGAYMRELGRTTPQHEIDRSRRSGEPFVLAFVDVDGLKELNDGHGHAAGDAMLRSVVGSITVGLARLGASETLEELTVRADLNMYAHKPAQQTKP